MASGNLLLNKRLIAAVYIGSLGGFVFGYDLGALSAATESLRDQFHLDSLRFGLTVSCSIWGTVAGSMLAGRLADRRDRRQLLAASALLYASAAAALAVPVLSHWYFILAMRFLCGMSIGGFTVASPLYLAEIAPASVRGRVVGFFQVQVGLGVIVAFSAGAILAHVAPAAATWKFCLPLGAVPASLLCLLASSARFPAPRGAEKQRRVSQVDPANHSSHQPPDRSGAVLEVPKLFVRANAHSLLVATSIAVFNQFSGVNILLVYMLGILASAGMTLSLGHTYTVLISWLGLVVTFAGTMFIDRIGRKPLLYIGSFGMAVCLVALGLAIPHHLAPGIYLIIFVAYNAFFAFSQGTVVWVYLSELFPPAIRGLGQGYGSTVHWIVNALLISIFPAIQHASTVGIFYVFALMMGIQIVVIWLWYPETKGLELQSPAAAPTRSG